jgi:hypothetical protein
MSRVRIGCAVVAALVLVAVAAESAAACSCVRIDQVGVNHAFRHADAALVGRLIEVRPAKNVDRRVPRLAVFRYRVERSYKRRLGRIVSVSSSAHEASCGLPTALGQRYAMFLDRQGRRWSSGLCSLTTLRVLREAARAIRKRKPKPRGVACTATGG